MLSRNSKKKSRIGNDLSPMLADYRLQIRSNSIIRYPVYPPRSVAKQAMDKEARKHLKLFTKKGEEEKVKTYSGTLCPGARKRLTKAIEFLVLRTKENIRLNPVTNKKQTFRITFLTLTVYSTDRNIEGKEAHSTLLEPFLQWMRRNYDIKLYVWKAELQKRGQIHYHLTFDGFIDYREIRSEWNRLQRKAGYLDSFFAKYGRWNPSSTHIHSVRKIKNTSGYLTKEIAKSFQNEQQLGGKVWDCSKALKGEKYYSVLETNEHIAEIQDLIQKKEAYVKEIDHCIIYTTRTVPAKHILTAKEEAAFDNLLFGIPIPKQYQPPPLYEPKIVIRLKPGQCYGPTLQTLFDFNSISWRAGNGEVN